MEQINNLIHVQDTKNLTKDDYEKDGLIYCGKCHTPKQKILNYAGTQRKVNCMCQCESEEYDRQIEEERQRERQEKVNKLKLNSLMGERYANASFDTCQLENESFKRAFERCRNYCINSKEVLQNGYGIYLWGSCGTGKTHLMACMCNELMNQLKQCIFTNFFDISKSIRATFSGGDTEENLINKITNCDFLFIDDLGTEVLRKGNDDTWLQEKIYDIINKRYNAKKPTVFTSNYSFSELINDRGMMIKSVDRIVEMSNAVIKLEGNSYRKKVNKQIPF